MGIRHERCRMSTAVALRGHSNRAKWTYFAGAGLINGNKPGAFNGGSGFVGNQYAFIQGQNSYISQILGDARDWTDRLVRNGAG